MPGRNQMGPAGLGPRTGRGLGLCAASQTIAPEKETPQGMSRGCGRRLGCGTKKCFGYRGAAYPVSDTKEVTSNPEKKQEEILSQKK